MSKYLVYNFSGELDDVSHVFPNERLGRIAAVIAEGHGQVTIMDRANFTDLVRFGSAYMENLGRLSFADTNDLYESQVKTEAAAILATGCEVLFLNLWHGTGFKFSIDLAQALKRADPALRIYGVGQKVDWFQEHILELAENNILEITPKKWGSPASKLADVVLSDHPDANGKPRTHTLALTPPIPPIPAASIQIASEFLLGKEGGGESLKSGD